MFDDIHLSACLSAFCLFYPSVCLSVCFLSVLSICLPVCLLSVCFIHLSAFCLICLSVWVSHFWEGQKNLQFETNTNMKKQYIVLYRSAKLTILDIINQNMDKIINKSKNLCLYVGEVNGTNFSR